MGKSLPKGEYDVLGEHTRDGLVHLDLRQHENPDAPVLHRVLPLGDVSFETDGGLGPTPLLVVKGKGRRVSYTLYSRPY